MGPSHKISLGGASYKLTIIDDYSRKVWPYFLNINMKLLMLLESGKL
jgi:hypothetical protein